MLDLPLESDLEKELSIAQDLFKESEKKLFESKHRFLEEELELHEENRTIQIKSKEVERNREQSSALIRVRTAFAGYERFLALLEEEMNLKEDDSGLETKFIYFFKDAKLALNKLQTRLNELFSHKSSLEEVVEGIKDSKEHEEIARILHLYKMEYHRNIVTKAAIEMETMTQELMEDLLKKRLAKIPKPNPNTKAALLKLQHKLSDALDDLAVQLQKDMNCVVGVAFI